MFKQNLFKHLLSILAVASITSFAGVGVSYAEGDDAVPAEVGDPEENTAEQKEKCEKSGGTWADGVCQCKKANTVEKDGMCVCKDGYKLDGAESLGEENAKCVVDENTGTGSTETQTGSDPVGAATGIKIATKSFNDARFSYVRRDLDETIATIRDVVSNAITNTNNIAALQSGKQTRPDDNHACETGKTCLLVTDTSGIRNWYEIIDCNKNAFLANVGSDYGFGNSGYYGGYTNGSTGYRACTESNANCGENQWMRSFAKGVVYGEARAVQISNSEGAIVTLPQNVQSGNVCVCRATGYRVKNGDTYGALQPISTDAWVVNRNQANTDQACLHNCSFDGDSQSGSGIDVPYYAYISNTCMASASEAQMCRYHEFFNTVVSGGQYERVGSVDVGSDGWSACIQPTGYFSTGGHCVEGGWVIEYTFNGGTQSGYVWGRAGYVTLPQGTSVGDVVDITNANDFSLTSSPSHNAYVCIVDGYRGINASSDQTLGFTKAYVAQIDGSNSVIGSLNATGCAEWAQNPSTVANHLGGYYTDLAEVCDVY